MQNYTKERCNEITEVGRKEGTKRRWVGERTAQEEGKEKENEGISSSILSLIRKGFILMSLGGGVAA